MWSLLKSNIHCAEKEYLRNNQIHFENLLCTKARVDNKGIEIPNFLKNKSYLRELVRTRERKIKVINNMMNYKLKLVAKSPSCYSKEMNSPKYCPAFDRQRFNYSKVERERKIFLENESFYKRFKEKKSSYSSKNFLIKYDYERYIKNNISRSSYPQRFSLKLCTFREFKTNLIRESNKLRKKLKYLNETSLSDSFRKCNSIEYKNNYNNDLYFSIDINKSSNINSLYNKKTKSKVNYIRNKINDMKYIHSKPIKYKLNEDRKENLINE